MAVTQQVIPSSFVREFQLLMTECGRHTLNDRHSPCLISRLEATISTVEEGIQLLSSSAVHETEHSVLSGMRTDLSRHLRLLLYGFNDCTVPPVALASCRLLYSGFSGRPRILVNIDTVELLRSCGYTWNQVAESLNERLAFKLLRFTREREAPCGYKKGRARQEVINVAAKFKLAENA